jgi:DNA helicase-2/ATP-dependent DNA helicase PcrA
MTSTDHLLNDEQTEAVTAKPGNLLILAGAGSGKTRVLVQRIAWLIQQHQVSPGSIFAVTFTNKAANEMRQRLAAAVNDNLSAMWIGTFHSLAHKLLRIHHAVCNLPAEFRVLDSDDQIKAIKAIMKKYSINEERWEPKQVQHFINQHKDKNLRANAIPKPQNNFEQIMTELYKYYEEYCTQEGLLDFSELLLRSYELLLQNQEIRELYQKKFPFIFVDEFQDTNRIQYQWLKLLAIPHGHVTVVGDDDQSIYGWRGACIDNIYAFEKDFAETKIFYLKRNYRSTGNILAAANALIGKNSNRFDKNLWTEADRGAPISLYLAYNEEDEALFLAKQIMRHYQQGQLLHEIAILYRSNALSRIIEEMLLRAGISYQIYGGLRFFERAEIKDALAYLRLALNQHDNSAFERIINVPARNIGERSVAKIRETALQYQISLWDASKLMLAEQTFPARTHTSLETFMQNIATISSTLGTASLEESITNILQHSGLISFFKNLKNEVALEKLENLEELVNAARDFAANKALTGFDAIREFLALTVLDADGNSTQNTPKGIQMMTIHAAKGLEFPVVFLCGMEEGLFPHYFSQQQSNSVEEERRLCYVGITRAKQKLYLSYARMRRVFGKMEPRRPSRFINELPASLLHEERQKR